ACDWFHPGDSLAALVPKRHRCRWPALMLSWPAVASDPGDGAHTEGVQSQPVDAMRWQRGAAAPKTRAPGGAQAGLVGDGTRRTLRAEAVLAKLDKRSRPFGVDRAGHELRTRWVRAAARPVA